MQNDNSSPILDSNIQIRNHDVEIRIHDFDGTSDVAVTAEDGESITIPHKFLNALGSVSHQALSILAEELDKARRTQFHPSSMGYELLAIRRQHVWSSSQAEFRGPIWQPNDPQFSTWDSFCLAEHDPNQDGTPYIEWQHDEDSNQHGWALRVSGIKDVNIAWAEWDDADAIKQNIEMMKDPEGCVVIGGIVNAEATSQMTARRAAKALRSGRKLPGINMKKVKAVFHKYQSELLPESTENSIRYYPSAKIVSLPSGDKRVPVAVAISAPHRFPHQDMLSLEQRRTMSYPDIEQFEKEAYKKVHEPWLAQLTARFVQEGWRAIELPTSSRAYYYRHTQPIFFTLIPESTWTDVSAGVMNFTRREFDMSRSTTIERES